MDGTRRTEAVRLGQRGYPWVKVRDDGLLESTYYVYETMSMHLGKTGHIRTPEFLPKMSIWDRILTGLGLKFWWYSDSAGFPVVDWEDSGPPRRPGRMWHGFSAVGGPMHKVWLMGSCAPLWELQFNPPVHEIPHTRPHGTDWPAHLLGYHDLTLTFVHTPGTVIDVEEQWSDSIVENPGWEVPTAEGSKIKMISGMIGVGPM